LYVSTKSSGHALGLTAPSLVSPSHAITYAPSASCATVACPRRKFATSVFGMNEAEVSITAGCPLAGVAFSQLVITVKPSRLGSFSRSFVAIARRR
jgi:hypothetical protein